MGLDLESIFHKARALPPPERPAYLASACQDDDELRRQVEILLNADENANDFLTTKDGGPTARQPHTGQPPETQPGQTVDRYKLLEPIGEGGFGKVWMAQQSEPVKRRVALKIIKLGMDTKQVIARFEAERQALAIMDHPNIAKVFDAGATETGRPYFVMEYIRGIPIIEYCDTEKLSTARRLELFIQVCNAIQHAHQKGIIHRDIKPSNVLITLHDGVPVPKVIDFGIAKATNAELTEKTLFTEHRQMVGTPAYMSPEQAEMSGLDIDTRADIYSLGVLLYELLTGTTPFTHEDLLAKGFVEMMRIIRETEPHKPSTRLSTLGKTASKTADSRRVDTRTLTLMLRGDLDWIVMKCLEKDRTRRYETASGLAGDILRHSRHEPVMAGPPGARYILQKFVRRNRKQVIAASAVIMALVLGVIGTSLGMAWALNERSRADAQAELATTSAASESRARSLAERELARATEIKQLMTEMFETIDPDIAQASDTALLKQILQGAEARLAGGGVADVQVAAELHQVIGDVYFKLQQVPEAVLHANQARALWSEAEGPTHPNTLDAMYLLAMTRRLENRYEDSSALLLDVVKYRQVHLGEEHPDTLQALNELGVTYHRQERRVQANVVFTEVYETARRVLGEDDKLTIECQANWAINRCWLGQISEAEAPLVDALEKSRRVLGPQAQYTLWIMNQLGIIYRGSGRAQEAEALHREALRVQLEVLGEVSIPAAWTLHELARACRDQGKTEQAAALFERVLDIHRELLDNQHTWRYEVINEVLALYGDLDRDDDATRLDLEKFELAMAAAARPDATSFSLYVGSWMLLLHPQTDLRDIDRGRAMLLRACNKAEAENDTNRWRYLSGYSNLLFADGDLAEAVHVQRRAVEAMPEGTNHMPRMLKKLKAYEQALSESKQPG